MAPAKIPFTALTTPVVLHDNGARTVTLAGEFILKQLELHRANAKEGQVTPPLFVGVQGPQGCGKSHLTGLLPASLVASHQLKIATLSLDDLYLTHQDQLKLAESHPTNKLFSGRGQPGTHDLPLALSLFTALKSANEPNSEPISLPVYDKSQFSGQGDRSPETVTVAGPLDLVIFEGWMAGFYHLSPSALSARFRDAKDDPMRWASENLDYPAPAFFLAHKEEHLLEVNEELKKYVPGIWKALDCFIQLQPVEMSYVWKWRLQQEHAMKAKNGGIGMTDDEVKAFIGRYMPGYELWLEGIQSQFAPWKGKGLQLVVGEHREILGTRDF